MIYLSSLQGNKITSKGALMLFNSLKEYKSLIRLINLNDNELNDDCMESLGNFIGFSDSIVAVDIGKNEITDRGVEKLPYLNDNTSLKRFNISNNKGITFKSIPMLVEKLNIDHIDVTGIPLASNRVLKSFQALIKSLRNGYNSISINFENMTDNNFIEIQKLLIKYGCSKLKNIDFSWNNITSKCASILFDILNENKSISEKINMRHNQLDENCMKSLGIFIQNSQNIKSIDISSNRITDGCIEILLPYLIGNLTLLTLDISSSNIVTDISVPLLNEIIVNSNIENINIEKSLISNLNILVGPLFGNILKNGAEKINLNGKNLIDNDIIDICNFIKIHNCGKLKELYLQGNKITSKSATVLFNTFENNESNIILINLNRNRIDDDCMESLGDFIKNSQAIENIHIGYNKISDRGIEILFPCLIGNITIKEIDISYNEGITDKSTALFKNIIEKSNIKCVDSYGTQISNEGKAEIKLSLSIPIDEREIPLITIGNVKSASKKE